MVGQFVNEQGTCLDDPEKVTALLGLSRLCIVKNMRSVVGVVGHHVQSKLQCASTAEPRHAPKFGFIN